MAKQIKFFDKECNETHGGILLDNGDILCACCGSIIPADEQIGTIEIKDIYKVWIDFTESIVD